MRLGAIVNLVPALPSDVRRGFAPPWTDN